MRVRDNAVSSEDNDSEVVKALNRLTNVVWLGWRVKVVTMGDNGVRRLNARLQRVPSTIEECIR